MPFFHSDILWNNIKANLVVSFALHVEIELRILLIVAIFTFGEVLAMRLPTFATGWKGSKWAWISSSKPYRQYYSDISVRVNFTPHLYHLASKLKILKFAFINYRLKNINAI